MSRICPSTRSQWFLRVQQQQWAKSMMGSRRFTSLLITFAVSTCKSQLHHTMNVEAYCESEYIFDTYFDSERVLMCPKPLYKLWFLDRVCRCPLWWGRSWIIIPLTIYHLLQSLFGTLFRSALLEHGAAEIFCLSCSWVQHAWTFSFFFCSTFTVSWSV